MHGAVQSGYALLEANVVGLLSDPLPDAHFKTTKSANPVVLSVCTNTSCVESREVATLVLTVPPVLYAQ